MGERIRTHLRSNIVGYAALFVALSGVTYAAGLKKNSVKSKQIKDGQVLTQDIGDGAVTSPKVANGSLLSEDFAAGQVPAGATGPQGPQGVQGLTGPAGSPDSGADILGKLAGVDGGGSGLDADAVDGLSSSAFALAGHNHDATYVNEGQANSISASMISNPTRSIQIPLTSLVDCTTDSGAAIDFASGADRLPDFVGRPTDGEGFVLRFDDTAGTEDDAKVCVPVIVPPDAAGGPISLTMRTSKDANTNPTIEVVACNATFNGGTFVPNNRGIFTPTVAQDDDQCFPTPSAYAPGDVITFSVYIINLLGGGPPLDDQVDIHGLEVEYTATQ